jgi:hypothetical protein
LFTLSEDGNDSGDAQSLVRRWHVRRSYRESVVSL